MKTTGFLKSYYFGFGILMKLFNRSRTKNKSKSLEELKKEIIASDYLEKVNFLIKQDLLLKYRPEIVEEGLEDLQLILKTEGSHPLQATKEEENVLIQKQTIPAVGKFKH